MPAFLVTDNGPTLAVDCGISPATTMRLPSMSATVASMLPPTSPNQLTIQDLNQRLPSIVQSAPSVLQADDCGKLTTWVRDNPMFAAIGLAALAWYLFEGKR